MGLNLREKINSFIFHPFVKDTAILQIGNIISIGISIVTSILIARLLQPEKYGLYVLVFSFAGLIALFMNLGAGKATLTLFSEAYAKKDKEEIKNILTYFLKLTILISGFIGLIGILLAPFLSQYFYHSIEIGKLGRLVILTDILIGTFFGFLMIILQILRQMVNYTIIDNLNNLLRSGLSIFLVVFGLGVFGVTIGHLIIALVMLFISVIFYEFLIKKNEYLPSLKDLFQNFWQVPIKKYFKFSFLIAADENLSGLYGYLPMFFLGMFAAVQEIGYLKIAFNYVSLPLILLGPVAQLLNIQLPVTKTFGLKSLKNNFIKTTVYSFFITAGLMAILILLAPFLVGFFYGPGFLPSVRLIYYLAGLSVLLSIGIGIGSMFRTLNKMAVALKINVLVILFGLPVVFELIKNYGALGAGLAHFGWLLISDIIGIWYLLNFLKKK